MSREEFKGFAKSQRHFSHTKVPEPKHDSMKIAVLLIPTYTSMCTAVQITMYIKYLTVSHFSVFLTRKLSQALDNSWTFRHQHVCWQKNFLMSNYWNIVQQQFKPMASGCCRSSLPGAKSSIYIFNCLCWIRAWSQYCQKHTNVSQAQPARKGGFGEENKCLTGYFCFIMQHIKASWEHESWE